MSRPAGVVRVADVDAEKRPRFLPADGIASRVRAVGDRSGLGRMGVSVREIDPGMAGTHRHWHDVEEEWVFVLAGTGTVRLGPSRIPVRAGSFVGFPPGPCPHHFVASGPDALVLLEGGERRPGEDSVRYPDLGRVWRHPHLTEAEDPEPREEGDVARVVQTEALPQFAFDHPVDSGARRDMRSLHTAAGLVRQAVRWARVSPGSRSTAFHTHDRTDEWVYILDGRARLRIGQERGEVGTGDFIGHPAGGPPHVMESVSDLTYLMGGQIDPEDTVIYPEARKRLRRGRLEPLP